MSHRKGRMPISTPRKLPAQPVVENRPSFENRLPLPLREIPSPPNVVEMVEKNGSSYVKAYKLGPCTVIVTRTYNRWHLSIAHRERLPFWDEVAEARYRLVPEEVTMAMLLPPRNSYVNHHEFCFQMVEIGDPHLGPQPPYEAVPSSG
jgi:hypothetical protein